MVVGAGAGSRTRPSLSLGLRATGRGDVLGVQVLIIEQLHRVHADCGTYVQSQLPLQQLPLAGETLFRVHFTWYGLSKEMGYEACRRYQLWINKCM